MNRLLLSAVVVLVACSNSPAPMTVSDAQVDTNTMTDVSTAPDTSVTDVVRPPQPWMAVPYRSETPQRMFPGAETILEDGQDYRAIMETDAGRMVFDLYEQETPITVNSFVYLSLHHFYEGIAFHRVLERFMAQAGDPNTLTNTRSRWGTGGPGYMFNTESVGGLTFDAAGVLGMARAQTRDTNGSQFFVTLVPRSDLNGNYTVFGRLTDGLDVLPLIARNQAETVPPATPTRIMRVTIESRLR
jgi:cyclophilin family peptidyl-prolyl cis-trans isomerase